MHPEAYFIGSLIFGIIWIIFFLMRPDLRREMLSLSIIAGVFGPVSEHFYLSDYWQPEYLFSANLRIEDFVAGFFLGGISAVGYEVLWRKRHKCACDVRTTWMLPVIALFGLFLMIFLFHVVGWNSIYASIFSFAVVAVAMLALRPSLIPVALGSGLVLAVVMFVFYLIYQRMYPGIIEHWWRLENISGILLLGVPIEELLWGFSWGLIGGSIYEFSAKVKLT